MILTVDYGRVYSLKRKSSSDADRRSLPWYTYPAIEYINQLDYSDKTVFEWGTGNSTYFWAGKAREVTSVEDDDEWFKKLNRTKPDNVKLVLAKQEAEYINKISQFDKDFDLIIIDGSYRYACAKIASNYLKNTGFIILDNSDWYPNSCKFLRDSGLIQIDFSGFGPFNGYAWCTSLFLTKDFDFKRSYDEIYPIGGLKEHGADDV